MRSIILAAAVILAGVLLGACGDDEKVGGGVATTPPAATGAGASQVDVQVQEFSVLPEVDSADAGDIRFNVENTGPNDPHEFMVIKTDLDPDALPAKDDGSADEEAAGVEVIDEIEEFPVGETMTLTVNLEAGSYALICNLVEEEPDGTIEAHYQEGMRTAFTVE